MKTAVGASVLVAALLSGCTSGDSIDESGNTFDAIASDATVNLVGNEPFWGIAIVPTATGLTATYSTPENIEGSAFAVEAFAGNNGMGYSGELDGEPVQIALTPGECSDTMSDALYPYVATVGIGEVTLQGCGYTSEQPKIGGE